MIGWLRASLRQFRDERISALALFGIVIVTAFVATAAPGLFQSVSDDALRQDIAAATASVRSLQLIQTERIEPGPDGEPLAVTEKTGQDLEAQIPPEIEALVSGRSLAVETPRWGVNSPTKTEAEFLLRFQTGLDDRIRITTGRLPTGRVEQLEGESQTFFPGAEPLAFEGIVSDAAAQILGLKVGDRVDIALDSSDPLARGRPGRAAIDIVGTYSVPEPSAPYWFDDASVVKPRVRAVSNDVEYQDTPAFLSPDAYPALFGMTEFNEMVFRYLWRLEVDPVRLAASQAGTLLDALRRMESVFPATPAAARVQAGTTVRSGLLGLLTNHEARWRSALAVLAVIAIGPIVAAGLAIGLATVQIGRRRRPGITIMRRRGASATQLLGGALAQGLLLAIPASILGATLALIGLPGGSDDVRLPVAGFVAVGSAALFVAAIAPAIRGPLRDSARDTISARRASPRRLVLEGAVVGVAVLGVVLLRQRGVLGGSSAGSLAAADPFIAAVPVLVGIAAGLLAIRLIPIPMIGLSRVAAWRRDLVPVLAFRKMTRSGSGIPVLIVLLAIASFGAFASATLVHLDRAAETVGWQQVGAPFRVTPPATRLPSDLDATALPGVEAASPVFQVTAASGVTPVEVIGLDSDAYQQVVRDTPLATVLPADALASSDSPVAALVSTGLTQGPDGLTLGQPTELIVDGHRVPLRPVAVSDAFPTVPVGSAFVVVDRAALQATRPDDPLPTTSILLRADDSAAPGLRQALATAAPGASVTQRSAESARLRTSPVVVAVVIGVGTAAILTALYAALALTAALVMAGAGQADEVAHLRTLGLTRRQASGLLVAEHGPVVVAAIAIGLVLGLGLFVLLQPGLGLAAIIGSGVPVPLAVAPGQLAAVVAGLVTIVIVGIGLGAALQRRADAATAVRRGLD